MGFRLFRSTLASMNSQASYAADPALSRGRHYSELPPTYRSEYQRDRDRIIHAKAFRRLLCPQWYYAPSLSAVLLFPCQYPQNSLDTGA